MDWKIFFATFGTIFLAELGDKTQLANLSLAAEAKSKITVYLASILAFSVVTAITVCFGNILSKYIQPQQIRITAASLFIIIGILMFFGKI